MDNLANILGQAGLPEELTASLQDAFNQKVAEAREEAEMSIREEFAARYEHDKSNLVEAMDRMLTDVVQKTETQKADEVAKLSEAKSKLDAAVKEARAHYKAKLGEHVQVSKKFVLEQLANHIKSLTEQKNKLAAKQAKLDEAFAAVKVEMAEEHATRLKKIDEFVVKQVQRELNEFHQDHRALVETRVKLISESKKKLSETQKRFVKEAASKVETVINATLKNEMVQLHEDLERNRQNMFGRRIFEAVAAEFMTSYLAEGSEVRKLQNMLESKAQELDATKAKLTEAATAIDAVKRKVKLAEERASRTKIMTELLSSLRGEKRSVMESMLETTKTDALRATFDRLLPVVLNEGTRKPTQTKKEVLSETKAPARRVVTVTGDKANRLTESAQTESEVENTAEMGAILRLAGIVK
jgi:hypothetical protein